MGGYTRKPGPCFTRDFLGRLDRDQAGDAGRARYDEIGLVDLLSAAILIRKSPAARTKKSSIRVGLQQAGVEQFMPAPELAHSLRFGKGTLVVIGGRDLLFVVGHDISDVRSDTDFYIAHTNIVKFATDNSVVDNLMLRC